MNLPHVKSESAPDALERFIESPQLETRLDTFKPHTSIMNSRIESFEKQISECLAHLSLLRSDVSIILFPTSESKSEDYIKLWKRRQSCLCHYLHLS